MRLTIPVALRWGDMDAYGHVNNVEILRLIEEARIRAFWREGRGAEDGLPTAVLDANAESETWSVVASLEAQYLAQMPYSQQPVDVEVWLGRLGGASLEMCFEIYSPAELEPRTLFVRAATTIVTISAETGRPVRIADALRELWAPYVEEPVPLKGRR